MMIVDSKPERQSDETYYGDQDTIVGDTTVDEFSNAPSVNSLENCNDHDCDKKPAETKTSSRRSKRSPFSTALACLKSVKCCDWCYSNTGDPRYCCCSCCCGGPISDECERFLRRYIPKVISVFSCIMTTAGAIAAFLLPALIFKQHTVLWLILFGLLTMTIVCYVVAARYYVVVKLRRQHPPRPNSEGQSTPTSSIRLKPDDLSLCHLCVAHFSGWLSLGFTIGCYLFITTWSVSAIGTWMILVNIAFVILITVMHGLVFSTVTEDQYDRAMRATHRRHRVGQTRRRQEVLEEEENQSNIV